MTRVAMIESPYSARVLTRSELQRLDVYLYESPKLGRRVTIVRPAALALALEFEFTPDILVFTERPRMLPVESTRQELSFWTRTRKGLEQFHLLAAFPEGNTGAARAAERQREAIAASAREMQVALRLVPEVHFLRLGIKNANRLRLLPYVQTARDLPGADELRECVLELFQLQTRHSFYHLEQSLPAFDSRDIRAVTCDLIHAGQLKIDWALKLHMHAAVEVEVKR